MEFNDKVGIITGAAGVLGRSLVKLYIKKGAKLVLIDLNEKELNEIYQLHSSSDMLLIKADVTREEDVKEYYKRAVDKFGKIDFVINNAGIEGKLESLHNLKVIDFDRVININVKSVFLNLKYALQVMLKQGYGNIVNISSDAGFSASPGLSAYVTSKHGVIGLTKSAAVEYGEHNIRINSVCPGSLNSRMMDSIKKMSADSNIGNNSHDEINYEDRIPLKRFGNASEVAELVCFLTSDRASFINGSNYLIDGGKSAW